MEGGSLRRLARCRFGVPMKNQRTVYRLSQLARMSYVSEDALRHRIARGVLAARKISGKWYVEAPDVAALLDLRISELPESEVER